MRYVRYAVLAVLAIALVSISMANREAVTLKLLPAGLEELVGLNFSVTLPLFLVALGGVVTGLVIGFVWEWIREAKHRRDASRKARDVRRLEREMNKLKAEKNKDKDEILAILDEAV